MVALHSNPMPPTIKLPGVLRAEEKYALKFGERKELYNILQDWVREGRTIYWMADQFEISYTTMKVWAKKLNVYIPSIREIHGHKRRITKSEY